MSHKQFTLEAREKLHVLKEQGKSYGEIAISIGKSKSAVSREFKRSISVFSHLYSPSYAQKCAYQRRKGAKQPFSKITLEMLSEIQQKLENGLSPDQLVGRLKLEGKEICSHETIYQMIYRNHLGMGKFAKYLRRKKKKRRNRSFQRSKRGIIPNRIGIEERPVITGKGHWEGDTIIGKNHQGAIATFVDKCSKFLVAQLMEDRTSQRMNMLCKKAFSKIIHLKTFTFDNGKEFAGHQAISTALGVDCFFANPYSSWERGLNEHTNGLLRQYFPKKTDFRKLTNEQVQEAVNHINRRPRKALAYRTPEEVFFSHSDFPESIPVAFQT